MSIRTRSITDLENVPSKTPTAQNAGQTTEEQRFSRSEHTLACDSELVFFVVYSKNLKAIAHERICTQVFAAVALTIAST